MIHPQSREDRINSRGDLMTDLDRFDKIPKRKQNGKTKGN